jgi:hypothetical protein
MTLSDDLEFPPSPEQRRESLAAKPVAHGHEDAYSPAVGRPGCRKPTGRSQRRPPRPENAICNPPVRVPNEVRLVPASSPVNGAANRRRLPRPATCTQGQYVAAPEATLAAIRPHPKMNHTADWATHEPTSGITRRFERSREGLEGAAPCAFDCMAKARLEKHIASLRDFIAGRTPGGMTP